MRDGGADTVARSPTCHGNAFHCLPVQKTPIMPLSVLHDCSPPPGPLRWPKCLLARIGSPSLQPLLPPPVGREWINSSACGNDLSRCLRGLLNGWLLRGNGWIVDFRGQLGGHLRRRFGHGRRRGRRVRGVIHPDRNSGRIQRAVQGLPMGRVRAKEVHGDLLHPRQRGWVSRLWICGCVAGWIKARVRHSIPKRPMFPAKRQKRAPPGRW